MKKITFTLALLLCCGSAFAFDQVVGDITTGFSRDDHLGVVKDDIYKLMWQDGDLPPYKKYQSQAVHYCENLNFAGFDDWRLPSIKELLSITDDTRFNPAINKAFKNVAYETNDKGKTIYGGYWSSTKKANFPDHTWIVDFGDGDNGLVEVSFKGFVRCVRQY